MTTQQRVTDPVCGMQVDADPARFTSPGSGGRAPDGR